MGDRLCCWFQWVSGSFLLAFRSQHVLGSPVQLQGRDSADVFGEFRFPPHQRALATLLFLDLEERRRSKRLTDVADDRHKQLCALETS